MSYTLYCEDCDDVLLDGINDGANVGKAISDHDEVCEANDEDDDEDDDD